MSMNYAPPRGRIIMVDFQLRVKGGGLPPEMRKERRPCVIVSRNDLKRGRLVTVVPLSTTEPDRVREYHHKMDHRSFVDFPASMGAARTRWAKCDYLDTVSLDRCKDPGDTDAQGNRRYKKPRAIEADMRAIEACIRHVLKL